MPNRYRLRGMFRHLGRPESACCLEGLCAFKTSTINTGVTEGDVRTGYGSLREHACVLRMANNGRTWAGSHLQFLFIWQKASLIAPPCRCRFVFFLLVGLQRLLQSLPPAGKEIRWWAGRNRARFPGGTWFCSLINFPKDDLETHLQRCHVTSPGTADTGSTVFPAFSDQELPWKQLFIDRQGRNG